MPKCLQAREEFHASAIAGEMQEDASRVDVGVLHVPDSAFFMAFGGDWQES
jgi:hypothetical protein